MHITLSLSDATDDPPEEESFVDVYTTSPVKPFFKRTPVGFDKVTIEVPTRDVYDCLIVEGYCKYTSEENRRLYTRAGVATVTASDVTSSNTCIVSLLNQDGSRGLATLKIKFLDQTPKIKQAYPLIKEVVSESTKIVEQASRWYKLKSPINKELLFCHTPKWASRYSHLPGFFFAVQKPAGSEEELFFDRALRITARRRNITDASKADMCTLMAETLAAIPNCSVYNADVMVNRYGKERRAVDTFSADERTLHNGDCEDMAREILNLHYSLVHGTWNTPLVRAAQAAAKRYVCGQQFAAVKLDVANNDPKLKVYSTGGKLYAHSFVIFMPARWVAEALQNGGGEAVLGPSVDGDTVANDDKCLVQDGISLFDPDVEHPNHPDLPYHGSHFSDERLRRIESIGLDYYYYASSCLVMEGAIESTRTGMPVFELAYLHGALYGAPFVDIERKNNNVGLVPTYHLENKHELAMAHRCAQYFHPIVPYDVHSPQPNLRLVEECLNAEHVTEPPTEFVGNYFLQSHDAFEIDYLKKLYKKLDKSFKRVYMLDNFAKNTFCVHIYEIK